MCVSLIYKPICAFALKHPPNHRHNPTNPFASPRPLALKYPHHPYTAAPAIPWRPGKRRLPMTTKLIEAPKVPKQDVQ